MLFAPANGPKNVRLFIDQDNIDFSDAGDLKAHAEISLTKEQLVRLLSLSL